MNPLLPPLRLSHYLSQRLVEHVTTLGHDVLESIWPFQDQKKKQRDAAITTSFLAVFDIQVRIATLVAKPGSWFRTCKQLSTAVKPAFMHANQAVVWDYLLDHFELDTQKALSCYFKQSGLASMEGIHEVHLDASGNRGECIEIMRCFPNCRELFISHPEQLTEESMVAIAQKCVKLERLYFDSQYEMTDVARPDQAAITRNLRMLGPHFGDTVIAAIATHCPELKEINLSCWEKITEEGLLGFAKAYPHLDFLGIAGCQNISDAGIDTLTRMCPKLTSLNLAMCFPLTDRAIAAIAKNCAHLVEIDLSGLYNCTVASLEELLRCYPNLKAIRLGGWDHITDHTLEVMAEHCPQLAEIFLSSCPHISDAGLFSLAECCHELAHIDLSFCHNITDAGVERIAEMCPNLAFMTLLNSSQITQKRIERIAKLRPNCELICHASRADEGQDYFQL